MEDFITPAIWRKGKKTILRPICEANLPLLQTWINDPAINKYLFVTWPMTMANERAWLEKSNQDPMNHLSLCIYTHDNKPIGNISLHINLHKQSAVTGTLIGESDYQNKGYGTDAKMLLLEYAFMWRGLRKVTSSILAGNGRSRSYAKKCGYRHTAIIPQEHFVNGKWQDEVQYTVFRDEWLKRWKKYKKGWKPSWL